MTTLYKDVLGIKGKGVVYRTNNINLIGEVFTISDNKYIGDYFITKNILKLKKL